MSKRHANAVQIANGASNPCGIANSIVEACKEVHSEGGNTCTDEAVRLMVHQLAYITGVRDLENSLLEYQRVLHLCEDKADE